MKTFLVYSLALLVITKAEDRGLRKRRGYFHTSYPNSDNLEIGGIDANNYGRQSKYLPVPQYNPPGQMHPLDHTQLVDVPYPVSNSIDKPVMESQENVPPQSIGSAFLPPNPPPATPVNAAASNVPSVGNSVFLGSGALGVIDLGGGAYVLGSGSIGYSERRSNPRSSLKAPFLPPIQASPDLIPAAVSNPTTPSFFQRSYPGAPLPVDENGYEYLPPDRIGFGDPQPPRPLRVTNNFATPSPLQIQPQFPQIQAQQYQQAPQSSPQELIYGQRISNVFSSSHLLR